MRSRTRSPPHARVDSLALHYWDCAPYPRPARLGLGSLGTAREPTHKLFDTLFARPCLCYSFCIACRLYSSLRAFRSRISVSRSDTPEDLRRRVPAVINRYSVCHWRERPKGPTALDCAHMRLGNSSLLADRDQQRITANLNRNNCYSPFPRNRFSALAESLNLTQSRTAPKIGVSP